MPDESVGFFPLLSLSSSPPVAVCYVVIGSVSGNNAANDGRWAAIFLANYHFWSQGTSYFGALLPPSPLQNFWSLAVDEQFYIVYPTIFLLCASIRGRISFRMRMAVALGAICHLPATWDQLAAGFASDMGPPRLPVMGPP
jgi:peptidoglycan/LPS O-acetylase OafA/YrhL